MPKLDQDLLYLRGENARIGLQELSHHLKRTPQRLKYTFSVMEKEGIVRDPYCIFDYSYFGLILFRVYFKGGYISEQDKTGIISTLRENPYIISISELTGEYDLCVEFASPNPSRFHKELKKISNLAPTLTDYKIVLNVVTHFYPRHYLTNNSLFQSLHVDRIVGGDREPEEFKEQELEIIKTLLRYPLARFTTLAKRSKLNVRTVNSIVRNLTERNVIKGHKYILDTAVAGISTTRVFLKLHHVSPEREAQLKTYLLTTPGIVQSHKTVGDWDMELDIEALDKSKIRSIIIDMREKFKDLIEKFNLIEVYKYYKKSYLPAYLFKEE